MIDRLLAVALNNRFLILLFAVATIAGGIFSFLRLPIDAFPDVSPVLVQVITETPGLAPEEVEKLVTHPVEVAMNGMPGVSQTKSLSAFGISQVSVYFNDNVDIYFARQLSLERLQDAKEQIPPGLGEPTLGPITTGLGQVYQYVVDAPGKDLMDTRTLQDWTIKYGLRTVPGVTEILSVGGGVKQYQVKVDPRALRQYGVSINEVRDALMANNRNVGGGFIVRGSEEYLIRGIGLAETLGDLGNVIVASRGSTPIYVHNLASVALGPEVRRGAATMNGNGEVVIGVVLKRIYENTSQVIDRVKTRVSEINATLPPGYKVRPFYDQSELVRRAVSTVQSALLEGAILVVIVLFLFLGNVRSSLIVTAMLPLSLLLAVILMSYFGFSANLMSLGGLAIAIGMMVDGGVVMVENVYRHLSEAHEAKPDEHSRAASDVILLSAREVGRPIAFAIAIIVIVFLPLITLQGVEGKMFKPMAYAVIFAMLGSLVFSLTVIPVLCSFFLKGGSEEDTRIMRWIKRPYLPALQWSIAHRGKTIVFAIAALVVSLAFVPFLGTEFIPVLEEGSILARATLPPSAGLDEAVRTGTILEKLIKGFPEVADVVTRTGRAEAGGDPDPVNSSEVTITLKPEKEWNTGRSKEQLVAAMEDRVGEYPGVEMSFTQPIANRVDELLSGVKAQLAVTLFGDDLNQLVSTSAALEKVISAVPGAADVQVEQVTGQPQVEVRIDRAAIARYGVNVDDVQNLIQTAFGGAGAGQVFEGVRRFDVNVRMDEPYRQDINALGALLVSSKSASAGVPLSSLADIRTVTGPKQISHDDGNRRIVVSLNVRGRDMGGFVTDAKAQIARELKLPPGYTITWGGQFENQQRAMKRLAIIVPITIALIFLLLFSSFGSLKQAALIILNIPFALIGGILGLAVSRQYLSVPASVGFIALFGVAVLNGVVLVSYINKLRAEGLELTAAVYQGTLLRLRPVLMTATVAILGLIPLLVSHGAGSEVQRPLAAVVVGGLLSSTALTLLLLPTLYTWFESKAATKTLDVIPQSGNGPVT